MLCFAVLLLINGRTLLCHCCLLQVELDFDDEDENRVFLLVHDTKPPFLSGQVLGGKKGGQGIVLPLKDPTSDMAVIAK
jgi:pre-mRNA-splicing factor ATP-dependent RNA helicase DHX38/PRP16